MRLTPPVHLWEKILMGLTPWCALVGQAWYVREYAQGYDPFMQLVMVVAGTLTLIALVWLMPWRWPLSSWLFVVFFAGACLLQSWEVQLAEWLVWVVTLSTMALFFLAMRREPRRQAPTPRLFFPFGKLTQADHRPLDESAPFAS